MTIYLTIDRSPASYRDNRIIRSAVLLVLLSGKTFYKGTIYSV